MVWANTSAGVAWYDGYRWHNVPCESAPDRLPPRQLQTFDADTVIGTGESQPTIYTTTSCKSIALNDNGRNLRIYASGSKTNGKLVVQDSELNYYSWDGSSPQVESKLFSGPENLASRLGLPTGAPIFLSTKAGLVRLTNAGTDLVLGSKLPADSSRVAGVVVRAATENVKGEGILSMAFPQEWTGLWQWSPGKPFHFVSESKGQIARQLAISDTGDVVAIYNSTEAWLRESGSWSKLSPVPAALRSPTSIFIDSRHRLWAATPNGIHMTHYGEALWSKLQFKFPSLNNHVLSLLPTRGGELWAGTNDGILKISPQGAVEHISSVRSNQLGLVTAMVQDHEGAIWCASGATFRGLWRYRDHEWTHFGEPEGLPEMNFHRVQIDPAGRVWALSSGGGRREVPGGVFTYNGKTFQPWAQAAGLIDKRVYSMDSDPQGVQWFASVLGLSRFDGTSFKHFTVANGLKANSIFFVRAQAGGGAYFLDRRNGLGEVDASGTILYHQTSSSAPSLATWELREDPQHRLWLTTRGGLLVQRDGEWTNIGAAAGLENQEIWPLAFWHNHACAGTDGSGIYCLNLEALNRPPPVIHFESPVIDGHRAALAWRVVGFGEPSSKEGNLTRHRLDGGDWSSWQPNQSLHLLNLSSGVHALEFQARDQFGVRSKIIRSPDLAIASPIYQQPIFVVPIGLSLIAAIVAIYAFVSRTYKHNRLLADKEESFRALIEFSSVGIMLGDRNRCTFYVSPAVSIILGYEPHELLGEFRPELIHPDDVASTEKRLATLRDNPGQTQRSRIRIKHKNGQYRSIEVISRNLFDNPSVGAIVTNLRDITDSTNAEMAADEARQRAEDANQAKSDFLAMISHEIRTPMNGITGMCQLLLESNLNKDQLDYAETIGQSAQSLLALVNDVLDFSRIEAGKLTIERAPIDLSTLINEVAQLMRVRANEKGLNLEVVYPADAPRAFYGDALRIRQILFNLTGNAVKFTHSGSVRMEATISYETGSKYSVSVLVHDTGIGISQDNIDTVFQKFTQADLSTTRRYGGSGLGLSISRSLAELMGGTIEATSTLGKGSEFSLNLQLDAAPENSLQRRDSSVDALQPLSESLDILLVEDNKVNQKLAMRLLEKLGSQVTIAASGIEALELLERRSFDLILMDCQMPEMDGYEATRHIREREHPQRHIPIIAITANAMESDLERCLTSGMDSYLTKPIDFIKLRDALETWGIDYRAPKATSDPGAS